MLNVIFTRMENQAVSSYYFSHLKCLGLQMTENFIIVFNGSVIVVAYLLICHIRKPVKSCSEACWLIWK